MSQSKKNTTHSQPEPFPSNLPNRKRGFKNPVDKAFLEYFETKRAKALNSSDYMKQDPKTEGLKMFLLSMLPDLLKMSDEGVRLFKRRVLQSIDNILSHSFEYTPSNTFSASSTPSTHSEMMYIPQDANVNNTSQLNRPGTSSSQSTAQFYDAVNEALSEFISAEERAGNNNFHNEKLGILHLFKTIMENIIDTPEGPGTKLEKNRKPKNKLDEADREYDYFYKYNKDTKTRRVADKVLEQKAMERFYDPQFFSKMNLNSTKDKIHRAYKSNYDVTIELKIILELQHKPKQIKKGGFLPIVIAAITTATALAEGFSAVYSAVADAQHKKRMEQETIRYSKEMDKIKSQGAGMFSKNEIDKLLHKAVFEKCSIPCVRFDEEDNYNLKLMFSKNEIDKLLHKAVFEKCSIPCVRFDEEDNYNLKLMFSKNEIDKLLHKAVFEKCSIPCVRLDEEDIYNLKLKIKNSTSNI
ncbi:hypothetical protein QTP88_029315 [Uroleucon formosanum]